MHEMLFHFITKMEVAFSIRFVPRMFGPNASQHEVSLEARTKCRFVQKTKTTHRKYRNGISQYSEENIQKCLFGEFLPLNELYQIR